MRDDDVSDEDSNSTRHAFTVEQSRLHVDQQRRKSAEQLVAQQRNETNDVTPSQARAAATLDYDQQRRKRVGRLERLPEKKKKTIRFSGSMNCGHSLA